MTLSDRDILERTGLPHGDPGRIVIDPLGPGWLQPASIDVRLGDTLRVYWPGAGQRVLDWRNPQGGMTQVVRIPEDGYELQPGAFVLGTTLEYTEIPPDLLCHLHGRSSLGRLGLVIHATAGLIDPGFCGQITLEMAVHGSLPVLLTPGMPIGQLAFHQLSSPAKYPYGSAALGSRYQGQSGPTEAREPVT